MEKGKKDPIRVLLVDDHPILRDGIKRLIDQHADMVVCGQAGDSAEALAAIPKTDPGVVIVDITLKNENGIDLIREMIARHSAIPVLVLSMHDESVYAERCLRAGAKGYVMKSDDPGRLLEGIRQVFSGRVFLSDKQRDSLIQSIADRKNTPPNSINRLTDREMEIFNLIGQGKSSREIAGELGLSIKTVEAHREHIKAKLGLRHSTDLIKQAVQVTGGV